MYEIMWRSFNPWCLVHFTSQVIPSEESSIKQASCRLPPNFPLQVRSQLGIILNVAKIQVYSQIVYILFCTFLSFPFSMNVMKRRISDDQNQSRDGKKKEANKGSNF